ncbi:unnamed protein product [Cylindrotheca closterium]|uniref:Uncharacterized protein n=1 Tax=Cylindrotheca closterium TaxID=2856 RepID=A0AAD2JM42_9STRA|nr:unnamed protein product [Cylindrotheca closterium]
MMTNNKTTQTLMASLISLVFLGMLQNVQSFQPVIGLGNSRPGILDEMTSSLFAGVVAPVREPTIIGDDLLIEDEEDDYDELVDGLTEKLEAMEGLWFSDDFYGKHGREWVQVSTRLVGASATSVMVAVKVTGDPHVPAGCVTWQTDSWPTEGGPSVSAQIQTRADPQDPDGFSWLPGELKLINQKQIILSCSHGPGLASTGTFHRQEEDDDEDSFA